MESDFQEPHTIDTRVVMGQEALLKTMELKTGQPVVEPSGQAVTLPAIPSLSDPQTQANQTRLEINKEESQVQTLHKQQDSQKEPIQPPNTLPLPLNSNLCPSSSEPITTDDSSNDKQEEGGNLSQDEVPCLSFSELACPVALSFSEPAYAVDPLRVGVPSSLDPDLYYTAPSTPIKMSSCSSHLKHHSYPGSPACPLSPGSPSDSEDLCSPLTSPSGSYITAEGGSWTSSYTSSTSPSASPNLLLIEETQEAPACFVASLSEIGDEVGDEKGRAGPEREGERVGELCPYRPEDYVSNSQTGITGTVILEEDEGLKEEEVKISRESCRPCWVTESTLHLRSSSSHSSDSQENGGGSESSLCPLEEATAGREEYSRTKQACLKLPLEACMSQDAFGQMEDHLDLRSTMITPDIEDSTMASSSLSPDSPVIPLEDFCRGAFGRLCPSSYMLSQAVCGDDIPEEERMIPASLISFPLNTSLVFKADSMEITLFPTEDENEIEEVDDRNEGKDVNAYAAGEEEADVEDDDDDEENYDFDDDVDVDYSGNNEDDDGNDQDEATEEAKVEVKVVEEEEEGEEEPEEDEDECDSKAVEDPTDEDSSASFLHSLSETSINEGLDESFCFQDDTDDSLDSASYNGEEDESLYSTERHAQSLEPTQVDTHQTDVQQESLHGLNTGNSESEHVCIPQNTDKPELSDDSCLSEPTATHHAGNNPEPTLTHQLVSPTSELDLELEHTSEIGHTSSSDMQECTERPVEIQKPSHQSETVSPQQESSGNLEEGGSMDISKSFTSCEQPTNRPHFDSSTSSAGAGTSVADLNISTTSASVTQEMINLAPPVELAEATAKAAELDLKQSSDNLGESATKEQTKVNSSEERVEEQTNDCSGEEPAEEPERDSYKLLIKPRHYQAKSQKTIGASRLALAKSFSMKADVSGEAKTMFGPNIHKESDIKLDQTNGNAPTESKSIETRSTDSGLFQNKASATNDLNKGVPLLSCPKDPTSNPSNIPVSTFPDIISEDADNLVLTPEHGPRDSAQENLRENTLSTDEGALGAAGSPHSPLAISPKRENSETDVSRDMGPGAGAWCDDRLGLGFGLGLGSDLSVWGAGKTLSLSLEKKYELESESLLMCDTKGQSAEMVVAPNMSSEDCKIYDNVMGFVLDEEDNNSRCERREEAAEQELEGKGASESNIKCWTSMEQISETAEGDFGSSRSPEDDLSHPNTGNNLDNADAQRQDSWRNSDNNNNSAFDSLDVAMYGNLNALSEEVRPQGGSVSVRESLSNIPLEEISSSQCSEKSPDGPQQPTDGCKNQTSTQTAPSTEGTCRVSAPLTETCRDQDATEQHLSSSDETKSVNQVTTSESDATISWLNGSFGSFTPKSKPKESGPKACQDETESAHSDPKTVVPQGEAQRKCEKSAVTSRLLNEPKTKDAFRGQQQDVCNSGEEGEDKRAEEAKKKGEKKGKKNKREMKTPPEQNGPENFARDAPKEELCTDKPATAKRGRRGKQNKHRASQTGGQVDSSPESVDDPKKASLGTTVDERSNETINNSKTETDQRTNCTSPPPDSEKVSVPGTENAESGSQMPGNHSSSSDLKSPQYCRPNVHTAHNLNVVVAVNPESHQKLEVLDNRPLSDSHTGATVDINDNNIEASQSPPVQDTISNSLTPPSSLTPPALPSLPLPATEPEDDLPTPVQESQPVLPAAPLLCSACTTTQEVFTNSDLQEVTAALSTSAPSAVSSASRPLPSNPLQPTQEPPSPGSRTQDSAQVSHSQSFSLCQPKLDVKQNKQTKQSCTWSTQDRCRG